jgi:hypothetical protein
MLLAIGWAGGGRRAAVRGGKYLITLAAASVLAAGCGTVVARTQAPPDALAAAVTKTGTQTARIAMTTSMQAQGMSVSFTATGEFDFAHSRGMLTMPSPMGLTELFLAPKAYIKFSGASGMGLPHGKSWVEVDSGFPGGASGAFGPLGTSGNPADLLASLTAIAGSERKLGADTIRGVPVTEYQVNIDPAKAAARVPAWERASFTQFMQNLGNGAIPVDVWVDSQNQLRRVRLSLHIPAGAGALGMPGNPQIAETTDFYDFGAPVRVSAPPASQVAQLSQLGMDGASYGSGVSSSVSVPPVPSPPAESGSLTPAQASAAEQAVAAFWAALGRNDPAAVTRTVLPAQRSCVSGILHVAPKMTVKSFRFVSAKPAGNGRATVRFTVNATVSLGGQQLPASPQGSGGVQWLVAGQSAGHWYVDVSTGSDGGFITGGPCS